MCAVVQVRLTVTAGRECDGYRGARIAHREPGRGVCIFPALGLGGGNMCEKHTKQQLIYLQQQAESRLKIYAGVKLVAG